MPAKMPLGELGVHAVKNLCVLDPTPPPLDFGTDLHLQPLVDDAPAPLTRQSAIDSTYWQPGGP